LLLVRVGGEMLAVRRAETTGLIRSETIVLTPGRSPAFLGLVGLRGGLYPIWSLATLLGRPAPAAGPAAWLVLTEARGTDMCAFACEAFEQMIFVPEGAIATQPPRDGSTAFTPATSPWGTALVPVVDLPALQADIWKRKEPTQPRRTTP